MAKKDLGYIELEWTCPNCKSRNKGAEKICSSCGAAQPESVQFDKPLQQELITDEERLAQAKAGPDIHCAYCGARNRATEKICSNCGADLVEGKARETGQIIGAFKDAPGEKQVCPNCGHENLAENLKCVSCGSPLKRPDIAPTPTAPKPSTPKRPPIILFVVLGIVLIGACLLISSLFRTSDVTAKVNQRYWERTVVLQQYGPVTREDWRDEIPTEGEVLECQAKFRYESSVPVSGAEEICGTPYTVDEGSGFGKVVQDCTYRVYEDFCRYEIEDWSNLRQISLNGANDEPKWPETTLQQNQRYGTQGERYRIEFDTGKEIQVFETSEYSIYNQATPGSRWILAVNGLGQVVDIEPAQ